MAKKPKKPEKGKSLADLNPELAKEWHPTKNGTLTPSDVLPGSQVKTWWKCPKGCDHEWNAVIADRNKGIGCAVCSNYKVVKSNCLETLNPELAKEWHPIKNGTLTPKDVHPGSAKKVWWKCPKGEDHEWRTVVHSRTNGRKCPICSGRKVVKSTCLETLNPQLAREWHPTKNGTLTPNDVGIGSGRHVWWKCPKGADHEWKEAIGKQAKYRKGCPICLGRKLVKSNSLAKLNPGLAKEWHSTKNGKITPYEVRPGSNIKVWWKCPKGDDHIWKTSVNERSQGTGCPICNPSTSAPELRIYCELKSIFESTQHRKKIEGYEIDIYIPELNLGIEYDGVYWHRNKYQWDKEKNLAVQSEIMLLRVREQGLEKLSPTDITARTDKFTIGVIKKILRFILKEIKINPHRFYESILSYLEREEWAASNQFEQLQTDRNSVVFENSISFLFPELAKQWHPTKNIPLQPEHYTPGSHKEIWWRDYLGREWQEEICHRVRKERNRSSVNKNQLNLFGE